MIPHFLLAGLMAGAAQPPAQDPLPSNQAAAPEADAEENEGSPERPIEGEEGEEIVVTGQRQRGTVDSDIPPEVQLNGREIRALGASNLSELLEALAPQTRSGRGRGDEGPVTLLNGRRISGFAEIRDIPPEAIQRVDILPEEVALRYGYRADQRVVNFVLRPRFRAVTTEVEAGTATAGGRESGKASLNVLRIDRDGRWSVGAEYQQDSALFESERDIEEAVGGPRDPAVPTLAPFRTLLPATEQFSANGTINRSVLGDVSATLNGRFELRSSESRFGLPSLALEVPSTSPFSRTPGSESLFRLAPAAGPLDRQNDSRNARLGYSLNGNLRPWRWSLTGSLDRNISENLTPGGLDPALIQSQIVAGDPALDPFGILPLELLVARPGDRSRSRNDTGSVELVVNGPLLELPAGQISASIRTGANTRDFSSRSVRGGVLQERDFGRDQANAQVNVDVPIASRRRGFLRSVGNLSANFNAEVQRLSDFGTLRTVGAGINWSPIEQVSFIASVTDEDGAPFIQQLGDPVLITPNARVFDFVRGETVEVTLLTGGNPDLLADNRRVLKLGATVRPLKDEDLSLTANYTDNSIRNPISGFPTATVEIEAAFPDRFERDEQGRLLRIDTRPVNFARSDRKEMRWGLNYSKAIGPQGRPGGPGRPGGAGGPGGGSPRSPAAGAAPAGAAQAPGGAPGAPGAQGARERPQGSAGPGGGAFRGGGGRPGGFGGGGFRPGGPGAFGGGGGGRVQVGLYHTWRFEDSVLIREGVPELDFLGGSAAGGRGGRPRHEIEGTAGFFKDGFGSFLIATWQEGTSVRGGNLPGDTSSDLFFSSSANVNLRLFANLGQQQSLVKKIPFLRGSRVTLAANNLFDSRPRVRDSFGTTPLSFQPNLIDPLGRTVRLSFRKMFF